MIRKNKKKNYLMVFLIFINIITFSFHSDPVFALGSDGLDATTSEISVETDVADTAESGGLAEPDTSDITADGDSMELDTSTTTPPAVEVEVPVVELDTVAPIITLLGDTVQNVALGSSYTDSGVTITDNQDVELVATVTYTKDGVPVDSINTSEAGAYVVHYNVSDATGNAATEVTRSVLVTEDATAPVITLLGNATEYVAVWSNYTDSGVAITDNKDIGLIATVTYTKDGTLIDYINTFEEGTYIVHYNVSDTAMNTAVEVTRTVIVGSIEDVSIPDDYNVEGYEIDLSFNILSDEEIKKLLEVTNEDEVKAPASVQIVKDNNILTVELKKEDGSEFTTSEEVTYDWYRGDELIQNGIDDTYTISNADKGNSITVKVEQYNLESKPFYIDQEEPPATIPEAVSVRINGIEKVGNILSGELIMENGNQVTTNSEVTYEWYRLSSKDSENSTLVGNNKTYKLVNDDGSKYIKLIVSYESRTFETITSKIAEKSSGTVEDEVKTPASIQIVKNNNTLTVELKKEDGSEFTTSEEVTYDWYRGDELIQSGIDDTYTISNADKGNSITVKVEQYNLESTPFYIDQDEPPATIPEAVSVRINGTEKVGNILSGELIMGNGNQVTINSEVTYEWYRLSSKDSENSTLVGNNKTYKLVSDDGSKYIKLVVSYEGRTFETITSKIAEKSSGTDEDEPPATIPEAVSVRINGTEKVGNTLSGELIMEDGNQVTKSSSVTYEWHRLSSKDSDDGTLIGDNKTYKLVSADGSKYIKLIVSYEDKIFEAITSKIAKKASSSSSSSSSNNQTTGTNNESTASAGSTSNNETSGTDNTVAEGWKEDSKEWKYIKNGQAATGWNQIGRSWYLMDSTGTMATGWQQTNGAWYLLNNDGAMATGWQQVNGAWYLLNSTGAMATGWQQVNGAWYLLNSDGAMATGWQQVNGTWYFLNSNGALAE